MSTSFLADGENMTEQYKALRSRLVATAIPMNAIGDAAGVHGSTVARVRDGHTVLQSTRDAIENALNRIEDAAIAAREAGQD